MLKQTISNFSCFGVAVAAFFLLYFNTTPRKELNADLTQVNKTEKALLSYFFAI